MFYILVKSRVPVHKVPRDKQLAVTPNPEAVMVPEIRTLMDTEAPTG